ncbi:Mannosylfructose-phosphate synthase [Chlamydia trachomatis]|nr:Mannosylfructose-phosphate synthase [Chlamydia trachomatis]
MKVLHVINSLYTGGAERLLVDSLPIYASNGIDVDLFLLTGADAPFLKELRRSFTGNIYISKANSLYSVKQLTEISNCIKKGYYDIIHGHLFPVLYWLSILKKLGKIDAKLVFTEHNTENRRINSIIFRQIDKPIYKSFDAITAITPQVKNVLTSKLGISKNKIHVIYNGIDLSRFHHEEDTLHNCNRNPLKQTTLIQISRFTGQKDQDTLIKAFSKLDKRYKLLLVGDGPRKSICEEVAKQLKIEDRVEFLGVRMDVPDLILSSDIVIQSSHWEGFGLTAIEGMAAGKPVIASDVPGLSELVNHFGLVFDKGNVQDLTNKILQLEDKHIKEKIVENCLRRAEQFSIKSMVSNISNLYKQLLNV